MKRKHLLLMLLAWALVPLAMMGQQSASLTVNEGTASSKFVPMYCSYFDSYAKSECVIPASDLTPRNGCPITAITFYPSEYAGQSTSFGSSTQQVFLKEVTSTTLSSYSGTSGATTVFQGTLTHPTSTTEGYTITFSTPYTYNGGNLLIGVYNTKAGDWDRVSWYGKNTTSNTSQYGYSSSSLSGVTRTALKFLPKTTFTYTVTTPFIALDPTTLEVFPGFEKNLSTTWGNVSGTPTITYTSSNNNVATVTGSGASATVRGINNGSATITASMTYNGTTYSATCNVTVVDPYYCSPYFYNTTSTNGYLCISNFSTTQGETNISNSSGGISTNGYGNFYNSYSVSATQGTTISFSLTSTYSGSSSSMERRYAIWVDWNSDYEFGDDEIVAQTTSSSTNTSWSGSFTIPSNIAPKDYRMRVEIIYANYVNPCPSTNFGEVEDYKLTVFSSYTITANASPANAGTITGGGTYNAGATATLTATANTGYVFSQWSDGNTQNPRTITVTGDATYTAIFNQVQTYSITVNANPANGGSVTGGGTYNENATATLTATANTGYTFRQWSDGNAQNPCTVTVTSNATYTAVFDALASYTINTNITPAGAGTVSGGGTYYENDGCTLTATANTGYAFTNWSDGNTSNPRTFTVTGDATYTAVFGVSVDPDVTIGSGSGTTSGNYLPTNVWYKYSLTQQIYTKDEVGQAGTITAISFYYNSSTASGNRTLAIYMSNTNSSTISSWITESSSNLVYSGSFNFNTNGWNTITLDTPFEYNGLRCRQHHIFLHVFNRK